MTAPRRPGSRAVPSVAVRGAAGGRLTPAVRRLRRVVTAALAAGMMLAPGLAFGQARCAAWIDRAEMAVALAGNFQERLAGVGITRGRTAIELWVSETGTFTVLETLPSGKTCLRVAGEGWSRVPAPLVGEPL